MADDRAEPLRPDSPVQVVMVNVTAPATLPAGYEFEAQVENGDPELTVRAVVVCDDLVNDDHCCGDTRLTSCRVPIHSLTEVLLKEMYFKSQWRRHIHHLVEDASRLRKDIGKMDYAAAATTDAATRVCGVPFVAHTVCLQKNA